MRNQQCAMRAARELGKSQVQVQVLLSNPEIWSLLTDVDLEVIASSASKAATALTYIWKLLYYTASE